MAKRTCSIDGCERPTNARGWCSAHYTRYRRHGDTGPAEVGPSPGCKIAGCERRHSSLGLCAMHYHRQRRYGDPEYVLPETWAALDGQRICIVEGCGRKYDAQGYCRAHYRRWITSGDPGTAEVRRQGTNRGCSVDGCFLDHYGQGYCKVHYRRLGRNGNPGPVAVRAANGAVRDGMGRKLCYGCRRWFEVEQFTMARNTPDKLNYRCRGCYRGDRLSKRYNITVETYDAMLAAQGGACAICENKPKTPRGLAVDHDHACCPANQACGACVRGLICRNCNAGIGNLRDDMATVEAAFLYLKRWAERD